MYLTKNVQARRHALRSVATAVGKADEPGPEQSRMSDEMQSTKPSNRADASRPRPSSMKQSRGQTQTYIRVRAIKMEKLNSNFFSALFGVFLVSSISEVAQQSSDCNLDILAYCSYKHAVCDGVLAAYALRLNRVSHDVIEEVQ